VKPSRNEAVAAALLGLVGCGPTLDARLDPYPDLVPLLERFYGERALEQNATCTSPRMTVTEAVVVDETAGGFLVDVRYAFQGRGIGRAVIGSGGDICRGFSQRRFEVARVDGRVSVVAMTGEQR
jgi:hypothetical protein